tara:strand:+ start:474 stop:794 length:321 start_codon:yes stop_codon:yes gene_type:complete
MVNKHVDGVPYLNSVKDVSASGVMLGGLIEPAHRQNASILVELVLSDGMPPLWLNCVHARDTDDGHQAFAFTGVNVAERRSLQKYVERYATEVDSESLCATVDQSL